jgi:hypothetical protein
MQLAFSELKKAPIVYQKKQLGLLKALDIENATGKVCALEDYQCQLFPIANVITLKKGQIILNKSSQTEKRGYNWIKSKVVSRSGRSYGRVSDLWLDDNALQVLRFNAKKSFLGIYSYSKRLFSVSNIYEVQPGKIIIDKDQDTGLDLSINLAIEST